jgi:hypothetical protein
MPPEFEQAHAKLECDTCACCLRVRSAFEHRIPQPPAPRGLEQVGPEASLAGRPHGRPFLLPAFLSPAPLVGSSSCRQTAFERKILERRVDTFGCHGRICSGHLDEKCTVPSFSRSPGHKGVYARLRGLCPAMTFIPSGLPRRRRRRSRSAFRPCRPAPSRRPRRCLHRRIPGSARSRSRPGRSRCRASPNDALRCGR